MSLPDGSRLTRSARSARSPGGSEIARDVPGQELGGGTDVEHQRRRVAGQPLRELRAGDRLQLAAIAQVVRREPVDRCSVRLRRGPQ